MPILFALVMALFFTSCSINGDGFTVTNESRMTARISCTDTSGENEIFDLEPAETHKIGLVASSLITLPATEPRQKIDGSDYNYTVRDVPLSAKTVYITNELGKAVVLFNGAEPTVTQFYAITAGATGIETTVTYYQNLTLVLKDIETKDYLIEQKSENNYNYLLIRAPGY
jgi:hypothetical protein